MRRAKKLINCKCGTAFRINLNVVKDANSINCPMCGQKPVVHDVEVQKAVDSMINLKTEMADYGQPFKILADYAYHKKFGDKKNPLEEYNVLMD